MSVLKVIEILTSSEKGWEDAAQKAVTHASKTVKNIRSVYVNEQSAVVENNQIVTYRVNEKNHF
jgi:flavin-binding protein dodecin